jgi:hypothetical protein
MVVSPANQRFNWCAIVELQCRVNIYRVRIGEHVTTSNVGKDVEWRKVAEAKDKEIEVHIVAGTHETCKTERLHDLSECLRMCLSKALEIEEVRKIIIGHKLIFTSLFA